MAIMAATVISRRSVAGQPGRLHLRLQQAQHVMVEELLLHHLAASTPSTATSQEQRARQHHHHPM